MEQYSFDRFGQLMPCPDREKCGAYLLSPLPDGTPRGCNGERKWCKMNFEKEKEMIVVSDDKMTICNSSKNEIIRTIVELIKVILEVEHE